MLVNVGARASWELGTIGLLFFVEVRVSWIRQSNPMASSDATSSGVNFLLDFAGFLRAHLISRHQLYRLLSSLNLTLRCPVFFLYSLNDLTRSWKFMCDMIVDKSAISCGVYATCTLEMKIRVVVAVRRVVAHHTNRHQRRSVPS